MSAMDKCRVSKEYPPRCQHCRWVAAGRPTNGINLRRVIVSRFFKKSGCVLEESHWTREGHAIGLVFWRGQKIGWCCHQCVGRLDAREHVEARRRYAEKQVARDNIEPELKLPRPPG